MRGECNGNFLTSWSVEEWFESVVLNGSVTGVGTIVFDVLDGVDDKGVKGSEIGGEVDGFELSEAVSARKVATETDVVGESGLFHKEENRVDGGIW